MQALPALHTATADTCQHLQAHKAHTSTLIHLRACTPEIMSSAKTAATLRLSLTNTSASSLQAVGLVGRLAKAMGKPTDRVLRVVIAPALKNLSDNKDMVRSAVVDMLEAWAGACGYDALLPELLEALLRCAVPGCLYKGYWVHA